MGNNRGTEYSWDHETYDCTVDNDYWMFTWADMGLYDDTANILAVKELTGEDKIFYVGYSQGTIQMFYGLAHLESEFHVHHLHKVVQLAPCFVANIASPVAPVDYVNHTFELQENGVYAINGPNWDRDLQTICDTMNEAVCVYYKTQVKGYQGQAVESEIYWNMNAAVNLFQEHVDDQDWLDGNIHSAPVNLGNITQIPISMFTGTSDETCPHDTAMEYIPQFGTQTTRIDVDSAHHEYFHQSASSEWFMTNLIEQLQVPTQQFLQ